MECGAHARAKELWGGGPVTDEPPEEGTVHKAVVKRIEPYGVVGAAAAAADDDGNDESMAARYVGRCIEVQGASGCLLDYVTTCSFTSPECGVRCS
eukprot:scaffold200293_cov21-Tisochrysis_lutea.AAC.1